MKACLSVSSPAGIAVSWRRDLKNFKDGVLERPVLPLRLFRNVSPRLPVLTTIVPLTLSAACALLAFASLPAGAQTQALDSGNGRLSQTGGSNTLGWSFNLSGTNITVTQLGIFDSVISGGNENGLANSHQVGLWNSAGTLLTSTTIGAGLTGTAVVSSSGRGSYRYVDVTNVVLGPGTYYLGASYTRFETDQFLASTSSVTLASGLTFNQAQISVGNGFAFPSETSPPNGNAFFGPNFRFTPGGTVTVAPEPGSLALLLPVMGTVGMVIRKRRNKK
jgi:hypothetical protein